MKLGLSVASYRWVCYPWLRYDTPEYRLSERRTPYFTSVQPPVDLQPPVDWILDRVKAHGLASVYMESGWLMDEEGAAAFKAKLDERGLVFLAGSEANLAAGPEEWGTADYSRRERPVWGPRYHLGKDGCGWTGGTCFGQVVRAMELAAVGGARIFNLVHGEPTLHNHFTQDPPAAEQIQHIIRNMLTLIPVAEALELVLTNESHMDYRVAEYLQVLEAVDSPWLRHTFDFVNSIAVVEDPLDAAQLIAPYTVATHIKDMYVQPTTTMGEPAFYHAPIGSGVVPIEQILEVLQAAAPDPQGLHHYVEVCTLPQYDAEQWVQGSLDWLRTDCARFWS
jgi:sugar phosphate isomerase/epimerase